MKILFVTAAPPFPAGDGARLIVANLARSLAAEHTLYLASLTERDGSAADMREWFAAARVVPLPRTNKASKWLASLQDPQPMWVSAFASDEMRATLQEMVRRYDIDVAHLDTAKMTQFADAVAPLPTVLALHDSLTQVLEQWRTTGPSMRDRLVARLQAQKMRRYEATHYFAADRVCVVTAQEQSFLQALAPTLDVRVIPIGVDTDYFAPIPGREIPGHIGFSGVMDYIPNRRAALYFANEIMPRIWQKNADAVFTIIGRNPTPDILALRKDARICVTGTVADVRPHVAEQQVMVAPMREPGGIKIKLLQALAMGEPIVATPPAMEGVDARPGHELLVGASADELARACQALLDDAALRARLGQNARAWATAHSWRTTADRYVELYREAMNAAAGR